MSPRFDFDPSKVNAGGFQVFPKDDYEMTIGEAKLFNRITQTGKNAGKVSYGVMYPLTIVEGEFKGKRYIHNTYYTSEEAVAMAKQFIMAGYGYSRGQEAQFNTDHADNDFNIDTDSNYIGDGIKELKGKRIIMSLDTKVGEQGQEQQDWKGVRPVE